MTMLRILSLAFFVGFFPDRGAGDDSAGAQTLTIRGRIYSAAQGRDAGIGGARVQITFPGTSVGGETITAADGAYAVSADVGDYDLAILRVEADGYFPHTQSMFGYQWRALVAFPVDIGLAVEDYTPTTVRGRVYDASLGPQAGIGGVRVAFEIAGLAPGAETVTAPDGTYAVSFVVLDDDWVSIEVRVDGYHLYARAMDGVVLRSGPVDVALEPAAPRVAAEVGGLVYDASIGPTAPIAGAEVSYVYHARLDAYPDLPGTAVSAADGRYAFELPLGPQDWLEVTVSAPGFATFSTIYGTDGLVAGPTDIALAPLGGVIEITPATRKSNCSDAFDVTIANRTDVGESLTILGLGFHFHYGGGVYGRDYVWDLSGTEFPLTLAPGEELRFPLRYLGRGDPSRGFPSRLAVTVVSGARSGSMGSGYYGDCLPACAGDCDNGRRVTVDELILGIGIALGNATTAACPSFDPDADGRVSISELVAAVDRALGTCPH
jgi:hypothetical protein